MFSIEHIGLPARDPAALKDWYVATLGAQLVFASGTTPSAFLLALGGGPLVEIYAAGSRRPEVADNSLAGWRHVALRVTDLDGARQHLEALGVSFSEPVKPAGGGGRVQFFADPEGNLLHLVERPPGWPPVR
jgi:catechol 2,3-dioxygenase-like lactoylglutathione lyase family enzyme